ncbi:hypothetical protein PAPYR_367 [Paratrimastix pyriformis]|uniref:Uncharacterized protein n=1 Tax=Paratrimastix pyriformis TaxID=342808 RepID=A0ABQ8UX08_9EUKA|nr:hypothetical protein PAPYR_367 [Paratrimastix pyriformis]
MTEQLNFESTTHLAGIDLTRFCVCRSRRRWLELCQVALAARGTPYVEPVAQDGAKLKKKNICFPRDVALGAAEALRGELESRFVVEQIELAGEVCVHKGHAAQEAARCCKQ